MIFVQGNEAMSNRLLTLLGLLTSLFRVPSTVSLLEWLRQL